MPSLIDRVADPVFLHESFLKALRGKRGVASACSFSLGRGARIDRLAWDIKNDEFVFSPYSRFLVKDPKVREIAAAPFRDRVVHRALFDLLEPFYEPRLHDDVYACRKGKGTSGAVLRALELLAKYGKERFVMKLDVEKYFDSIPHDLLLASLQKHLSDCSLVVGPSKLLLRLIESFGEGRGIPLGNLTSQLFANWYLTPVDRVLATCREEVEFVRYMDDILVLGRTKKAVLDATEQVLAKARELGLSIPIAKRMPIGRDPVPFLGFVLTENGYRPLRRSTQRFCKHMAALSHGQMGSDRLEKAYQSRLAWTQMPARMQRLRRKP